ncbi:Lrp/AsnC family transcriptional regulator [Parahaliea mediterranea]|uniref:Lrp/AsnC family transcriptional regulator n=1 Tax=Parahaliea mediterranea TaxID=651086 RepID=A0A939DEH8_9GAMM|nr:Lrp/AsnC family transcriptional regulator [Parahaliea mediterranea]MBN7796042.1 Lrp/AsnC family transcriptional regulator [Parahaliea mediterranea]
MDDTATPTPAPIPASMDDTDRALAAALEGNVRRPTREIADEIGISAPTAKRRIERLRGAGLLHLGPVLDLHAAGYEYLLIIGIKVEGRSPLLVAGDVAALEPALTVNVVVGACDVEVVAAVKSREAVSTLLAESLVAIAGVAHVDSALALEVWKFQRGRLTAPHREAPLRRDRLDPLDLKIVHCLAEDVRKSNRAIAGELAISESAVRTRIRRMQANKQLSMATPYPIPARAVNDAFVGLRVRGGMSRSVCRALSAIDEITFVCTTLGRHDIICCIHVTELEELTEVLHDKVISIPGVKSTAPSHCIKQLKHQSLLGLVL